MFVVYYDLARLVEPVRGVVFEISLKIGHFEKMLSYWFNRGSGCLFPFACIPLLCHKSQICLKILKAPTSGIPKRVRTSKSVKDYENFKGGHFATPKKMPCIYFSNAQNILVKSVNSFFLNAIMT